MRVLVGYIGYLFKGDCAVGLRAGELLRSKGVEAVELSGDVFTMVDELMKLKPDKLILVGAAQRGRRPGTVEVYKFTPRLFNNPLEINDALRPSLEGRISLEDLLIGLSVLGRPTDEIYIVECEPPKPDPVVGLSPEGEKCAEELVRKAMELYVQA